MTAVLCHVEPNLKYCLDYMCLQCCSINTYHHAIFVTNQHKAIFGTKRKGGLSEDVRLKALYFELILESHALAIFTACWYM